MEKRIKWLDVCKFFGIFAIYLGHFGSVTGYSVDYVFRFHVALFFFVSGCIETFNKETNVLKYTVKKIRDIMIPFWFFSVVSIFVCILEQNISSIFIGDFFKVVLQGAVRNQFVAASLWFLSCLFVMEILFFLIKQIKNKAIIIIICLALHFVAANVLNPSPIVNPSWYYNVDSALYFIVFYALGYVFFPAIYRLFQLDTLKKRIIFAVSGIITFLYSAFTFVYIDVLAVFKTSPALSVFTSLLSAILLIWFWLVMAKLCENSKALARVGQYTLYLCGSEYIIKALVPAIISLLGITVTISSPLAAYIYTGVLLALAYKYLVPIERICITQIKLFFENLFSRDFA